MQTYGNVFGDREESGLVLFLPIYTHTHTLTQKDGLAAQHY